MPREGPNPDRPPVVPPGLAQGQMMEVGEKRKTEKDLQEEGGGAGVYSADFRKHYLLDNSEWKYDIMPEIWDGHNVLDFVDLDIDAKLEELLQEEEELLVGEPCHVVPSSIGLPYPGSTQSILWTWSCALCPLA